MSSKKNTSTSTADGDVTPMAFDHTPGTELLYENGNGRSARAAHLQFKEDRDGNHVLLVPQPSLTDPNDPLRWSKAKKWATLLNGVFYAFMGSVTGPIMAAGMVPLSVTFGTTLQKLTYANGATLICQGVGNIFWMPLAIKFGRRPVYMFSNVLMVIACVWLGLASTATYTPFIIGRAFLGFVEAPIESIVPTTITDIFFLHDRGEKVSLYGLSVLGGNELGPVFSALIIQRLGMAWAFFIVAMFIGLSCITMFFFMPETKFTGPRPSPYAPAEDDEVDEKPRTAQPVEDAASSQHHEQDGSVEDACMTPTKTSYVHSLALWTKPDKSVSFRRVLLRPFVVATYPTVLWACLVYGMSLGWNVIFGATVAQLFVEPYGFDTQDLGLIFLSPFVGSLIGSWLCGSLADSVANFFTRKNNGIREPEMRLPACAPAAFLMFFGTLITALTYEHHTHWIGPIVGLGVISTGVQMGVSLSMSYALDCHKELSVELMVAVASLKSAMAWIWTWVINDWITKDGMLTVYMSIAGINLAVHISTIVLYIYGKRIRSWIFKRDLLGQCGLR